MHYFIDGYNLLFRVAEFRDDFTEQREKLIEDLYRKIKLLGINATIVFDSHHQLGEAERSHLCMLEIFFTAYEETADEFILHEIKKSSSPEKITVVTSDKKLAWQARRRLAKSISVEEFFLMIDKRCKNKLRREKSVEVKKAPLENLRKKTIKENKPSLASTVDECFDFYLNQFEKQFEEEQRKQSAVKPLKTHKQQKTSKKPKKSGPQGKSVMEYWLESFERIPDEDLD